MKQRGGVHDGMLEEKNGLLKIIIVLKRKQWQDGDVNLILIKLNYFCDNYIFLIITITTKMPNGWKKNAKYFNHKEMTHNEYVQKKNKLRNWKKQEEHKNECSFVDSKKVYHKFDLNHDASTHDFSNKLTQEEKSGLTFYMSKQYMKQSNATFKKKQLTNRAWDKPLFVRKNNSNKFTRYTKKTHKVYYAKHNKKEIKPVDKKNYEKKKIKYQCSICCEKEIVSNLFTVYCRRKGIGSFNKNSDKILCNSCMKKLDCCPYCRSHKLTCSLYKSKIKKKVKKTSLEQQKRKNKMKKVKRKIREYDRLKKALKTKYPTMILCHKNGVISNSDDIETIRRYGFNILPLKLYKYYLKYFKQLSFTSYDKAKHDIIITYAGFKEANYILDLLDNEYYYTYESEDELSDDESDDNYIFGVPDYVNS